jgi:hypothetical protein
MKGFEREPRKKSRIRTRDNRDGYGPENEKVES